MSRFEAVHDDGGGEQDPPSVGHARAPWHEEAPGPELAARLAAMIETGGGLVDLSDFDLVEHVAAAERVASWAHHLAVTAAAELAERATMRPSVALEVSGTLGADRVAGEELSLRLGRSARAGQELVLEGRDYERHLAATGIALQTGQIDPFKARAIRKALDGVPWQLALAAQDAVLPRAAHRTATQLANDVRNALVELDPAESAARRVRAERARYLSKPKALPDGMAGMWLCANAVDVHALYRAVDAEARAARRRGEARTLDQLRADLLVERGLHHAHGGDPLRNPGHGEGAGRCRSGVKVDVRVLVPLSTLIGTEDAPAELEGYGTIDPEVARAWARRGTWRRLVTDPYSGTVLDVGRTRYSPPRDLAEHVRFRDLTCVRPGCGASAWRSELDHTIAFHRNTEPDAPGRASEPNVRGGPTAAHNLAPVSKGCHQIKTHAGFTLERGPTGSYRWTTPTGHVYLHESPTPATPLANDGRIHRLRHELEELSPPGPAQGRPPPGSEGHGTPPPPF